MSKKITANELKTRGVSIFEQYLAENPEIIITVRGEEKYVVMEMAQYTYLRECELETALHEARAEYEAGNYVVESVDEHIQRLKNEL
jgi:phenolic acid decarboxylase